VLLYVTDVVEDPTKNADFLAKVAREKVPVLLVINKIDLLKGNGELEEIVARWKELLPNAEVFPTSAKEHFNVDNLMARIVELLPEGEPYFGKDALTDKPARFFVTEIIREKILTNYDKEIPYSTEVIVEKFEEKEKSIHIMAVVYVERDSQKGIIIGKGGTMLKRVGIEARMDIEKFFGKSVFLEIFVKVEPNWRNRENKLRQFGYIE
ncbi:MAG: GTPase Era, partial [Muribaculaceae bacterium]|nr:GTPase Era [Muribaculaceae bacterium]